MLSQLVYEFDKIFKFFTKAKLPCYVSHIRDDNLVNVWLYDDKNEFSIIDFD